MKTIRELWQKGSSLLKESSPSHSLDSQILLCFVLNKTREDFWKEPCEKINSTQEKEFFDLIEERRKKVPIAYLIKRKEFFNLPFLVNEKVLIPRPDTEILVEEALKVIDKEPNIKNIWDIGTGSGAIGLSVAKNYHHGNFNLVDISLEALETAKKNQENLKITNVNFYISNLLELWSSLPPYSLILANLPYLTEEETFSKEKEYPKEPHLALLGGGADGLDLIKNLLKEIKQKKEGKTWVLLESSTWQIPRIKEIMNLMGFKELVIFKDLSEHDRIIKGFIS